MLRTPSFRDLLVMTDTYTSQRHQLLFSFSCLSLCTYHSSSENIFSLRLFKFHLPSALMCLSFITLIILV